MSNWFKVLTPDDVATSSDPSKVFCVYAQQVAGIPYPRGADIAGVRKQAVELFRHHPQANWYTLCRVAQWARSRKKRYPDCMALVSAFRYAWVDGALPELDARDAHDDKVETELRQALEVETNPAWRMRLLGARGVDAQKGVIQEWRSSASV